MLPRPYRETWQSSPPRATVPPALIPWLTDPSSLTARIRRRCVRFGVQVLYQGAGRAMRDEAVLFGLRAGARVWVREVLLIADGVPVVFARSLLPRRHVRGAWNLFHGFGAHPLGAALFADPAIERAPLACTRLDARDARYHRAHSVLSARTPPTAVARELWGRRSLFLRHGRALMVSEFFLPAIFELPR
ncbi:chorismate--pyruvate lyase family protein [Thauera linaloolentis]|uniref:Probable chorismate pyruvate-lyase n=1 Tax=Thauera linaloolentis (strain DSM 12138 / JCM 21573 / CCUG 41526 / CIP 105981 / IAM 15112 / NBRC 102519 / 47Lol) TaxID=1123367 RepID=N6YVH0_THAL4|nr:chorismate lyase [Thauera linaloolentis]ENO83939.1 chorismate:pyruvate lyase, 4-hydroxybenzoate synthetase [Thauera linaloolentis 47Lol = DSM 12138]MCM8567437.1 chorismate lyase [Thauera linaloolentis]